MNYILVNGSTGTIKKKINDKLNKGYILYGDPFRSGNRILLSGDLAYPGSCEYTNEIIQTMTLGLYKKKRPNKQTKF